MRCAELLIQAESGSTFMGNDKDQKQNHESLFENLEEQQQVSRRQSRRHRVKAESAEDAGRGDGMQNRRLRSSDRQAAAVILLLVFAAGILAGILGTKIAGKIREGKEDSIAQSQITPEQERLEGIRQYFSEGRGVLETLRRYYPQDIIIYDQNKYWFSPLDSSMKMNSFDSEKVRKNTDGTWGYVDGNLAVVKGIDVSSHQGEIDWAAVAKTNVSFAMIRAMYRGYETGKMVEDKYFRTNLENAQRCGLDVGVYIFTQAISKAEVDEEVSMVSGLLGAYDIEYPVVVDVEDVPDGESRTQHLTKEERTELTRYYCEKLKDAGYQPMIYYNIRGAVELLDLKELEDYDKWFAVYDSDFYFPYAYKMWQYKDTGRVDGISGNVDLNLYFPDL